MEKQGNHTSLLDIKNSKIYVKLLNAYHMIKLKQQINTF